VPPDTWWEPGECQDFCVWGVFSLTESQVHNYIWRVSVVASA